MPRKRVRFSQTSENLVDSNSKARKSPFNKRKSSPLFASKFKWILIFTCPLLLLLVLAYTFHLLPGRWFRGSQHAVIVGDSELSVYEKGLVKSDITHQQVLAEAEKPWMNTTHRHFNSMVLAYVTPWNSKGYDMAIKFRAKLTHVSPVWYQLKRIGTELQLFGKHDADQQWMAQVRKHGLPLILPRVVLEGSPIELLTKKREKKQAIDLIVSECKNMGYDGVVLEAWSQWVAYGILKDPKLRQMALQFVQELGSKLHATKAVEGLDRNLQLVFVIPPPNSIENNPDMFTSTDMERLSNKVDGFSLMTYDFSNAYHPGPNAPIGWVRACLQLLLPVSAAKQQRDAKIDMKTANYQLAAKILMGINFYGNDYLLPRGGAPILGHGYLSLLRTHKPKLFWDEQNMEHYFDYEERLNRHRVFYPSLKSISLRLEEAQAWGVGLSIWEIGQGLEYFFDLL